MKNSINAKDVSKVCVQGRLFIQPQIPEILFRKQTEQTVLVRFGQNIWQHLSRWYTLDCPTGMTKMTLSIWHNCCHLYCSSVPCLQVPTQTHSGLGLRSVQLECTNVPLGCVEFLKILNKNFCWMEHTIKLDVVGIHLLCLGLTRGFNN